MSKSEARRIVVIHRNFRKKRMSKDISVIIIVFILFIYIYGSII